MSVSTSEWSEPSLTSSRVDLEDLEVRFLDRFAPREPESEIRRLIDPGSAEKTLHWGRNYLYLATLRSVAGEVPVVVKAFRNESAKQQMRRRWRGSKASRTWQVSLAMREKGFLVPEPVALADSVALEGPSYFISTFVDAIEARYVFRAMNTGREVELFPEVDVEAFVSALGRLLRRLHDERFWHRDVTPGNVMLAPSATGGHDLYLLDLNRTRMGRRLTTSERMRDLCRLPLFRREHQRLLLSSYWSGARPRMGLYLFYHHGFLTRNRLKKSFRAFTGRLKRLLPRSRHVHIEDAEKGARARDRIVWDRLTDQPHQHAGRVSKLGVRVRDSGAHLGAAARLVRSLPATRSSYRRLLRELPGARPEWPEPGICLSANADPDAIEDALEELGTDRVLMRLSPWEDLAPSEELARRLHSRGCELAFSIPQNRDLVRDPGRWRDALEAISERFFDLGRDVQVGHAINRSKWGVWNPREYERLMTVAQEVLEPRRPSLRLLGPAVIDFEFHQTAMALNSKSPALHYDIVSSLLYVDRRGAPENRQGPFDTVKKVALLKAVVEASRHGDRPCWITEVNWPLAEGPHSPAGRAVAVDEEAQADYLVRYYLLTLGTGLIERVYWWQLVARGYGLADSTEAGLRHRPSFQAFATLTRRLRGSTFAGWLTTGADDVFGVRLVWADGREVVVGWANRLEPARLRLPRPVRAACDRDGREIDVAGDDVEVTSSARYFELERA